MINEELREKFKKPVVILTYDYLLNDLRLDNIQEFESIPMVIFSSTLLQIQKTGVNHASKRNKALEVITKFCNNKINVIKTDSSYNYFSDGKKTKDSYNSNEMILKNLYSLKISEKKKSDYIVATNNRQLLYMCHILGIPVLSANGQLVDTRIPDIYTKVLDKKSIIDVYDICYILNNYKNMKLEVIPNRSILFTCILDELFNHPVNYNNIMSLGFTVIQTPNIVNPYFSNPDNMLLIYLLKLSSEGYHLRLKTNDMQMKLDAILLNIKLFNGEQQEVIKSVTKKKTDKVIHANIAKKTVEKNVIPKKVNENKKENIKAEPFFTLSFNKMRGDYIIPADDAVIYNSALSLIPNRKIKIGKRHYYKVKIWNCIAFKKNPKIIYEITAFSGENNLKHIITKA